MSEQLALTFPTSTFSAAASPAKTSRSPELEPDSPVNAPASGTNTSASSRKSARAASLSRTSLDSFGGAWTSLSVGSATSVTRWKEPGSAPLTSGRHTDENGCSLWPTPTGPGGTNRAIGSTNYRPTIHGAVQREWPTPTVKGDHNRAGLSPSSGDGLSTAVKDWATPRTSDVKGADPAQVGKGIGPLSPMWESCLMGLSPDWTERPVSPDGPDGPPGAAPSSTRGSRPEPATASPTEAPE